MLRGIRSRLTYANVVASMALFIALGGVSFAAVTLPKNSVGSTQIKKNAVTGAKVKDSSLTGSDIKNKSLTVDDFNGSTQGPQGAQGPKGDQGSKGDAGANGPRGPSDARIVTSGTDVLVWTGTAQTVASLALPAGRWVVWAKALANNNGADNPTARCKLESGATVIDDGFDSARVGPDPGDDREYLTSFGAVDLASAASVDLNCTAGTTDGNWINRRIAAIQVASLG